MQTLDYVVTFFANEKRREGRRKDKIGNEALLLFKWSCRYLQNSVLYNEICELLFFVVKAEPGGFPSVNVRNSGLIIWICDLNLKADVSFLSLSTSLVLEVMINYVCVYVCMYMYVRMYGCVCMYACHACACVQLKWQKENYHQFIGVSIVSYLRIVLK